MTKATLAFAASVALAILLVSVGNALMVEIDLEDLAHQSRSIVFGNVKSMRCEWNEEKTEIYTYVIISVSERLKGVDGEEEITLRHLGGEIGEIGMGVSDAPKFERGQDVFVFLGPPDDGGVCEVVGAYQGKYTIENGQVLEKRVALTDFLCKVKAVLKQVREEE